MIEIPEAFVTARQIKETLTGKVISSAVTGQTPHKFAWYTAEPAEYGLMLRGKTVSGAENLGGFVHIHVEDVDLLFGDGINLRYHPEVSGVPDRHQLLVGFEDSTYLSATVAMYGGLYIFKEGKLDNPYYTAAVEKPNPLQDAFDWEYFGGLFLPKLDKYSLKAFLATEQRIPGLGNGVLQDILYRARLHPKRKISSLSDEERQGLFKAIRTTLKDMAEQGGRDTEKDLFGNPGGYVTRMSKNTVGKPCPECGGLIEKQAYMGGSIYYCPGCQKE